LSAPFYEVVEEEYRTVVRETGLFKRLLHHGGPEIVIEYQAVLAARPIVSLPILVPAPPPAASPAESSRLPVTILEESLQALKRLRDPLYGLEVEKYRLTQRKLDQTIVERLLARAAAERGQTVSAFVTAAVQAQIAAITPEEIAARVGTDRAKLPPDEEQARKEARSALVRERAGPRRPISRRRITCGWPSV